MEEKPGVGKEETKEKIGAEEPAVDVDAFNLSKLVDTVISLRHEVKELRKDMDKVKKHLEYYMTKTNMIDIRLKRLQHNFSEHVKSSKTLKEEEILARLKEYEQRLEAIDRRTINIMDLFVSLMRKISDKIEFSEEK